jgi:hypothetical protein
LVNPSRMAIAVTLLCAIGAPHATRAAHAKDTLVLLDGSSLTSTVTGIDDKGNVLHDGREHKTDLQELRRITRSVKVSEPPNALLIYLADGSRLVAEKFKVESGKLTVDWSAGKAMVFPIESVRGILLPIDPQDKNADAFRKQFLASLADSEDARDGLFIPRDGKLTEVRGALDAFGQDKATFIWNDKPRKIDRKKIFGVVLASPTDGIDLTGQARAALADGSSIWGKVAAMAEGQLKLTRTDGLTITLPWDKVGRLDVRSDRMVFLSDLKPIRQTSSGIVTLPTWPIVADKSVMGNAITIRGKIYERGLGTHANASIIYNVGSYDVFAATIGIDDETNGRGDCVFKVIVDGKEKLAQRMTGKDKARTIRVPVDDANRIELRVEAGEDLDLADHANWADARLIREKTE